MKIVVRMCPHDLRHPDPDQFQFWVESGQLWKSSHFCDGCCDSNVIPGELVLELEDGDIHNATEVRSIPTRRSVTDELDLLNLSGECLSAGVVPDEDS